MLNLLWGVAALFVLLWVLGFALKFTMGGTCSMPRTSQRK